MKLSNTFKPSLKENVNPEDWNDWHWQMNHRLTTLKDFEKYFILSEKEIKGLSSINLTLPVAVTPYFASLMSQTDPKCPLRKQGIPTIDECEIKSEDSADPLAEDKDSPVPHLVHRYPDRVLLLVTNNCPMFCRYCTRRRIVGKPEEAIPTSELEPAFEYIKKKKIIRDVLISGGDPLIMSTERLEAILSRLREIKHVEILRIGTRAPATLPMRITEELTKMLKKYHPLWMSLHFSHPKEVTKEASEACIKLADSGIPLGSQTVLLKGVNDDLSTMRKLVHELLKIRVRPYYLYQCDLAEGTSHFRTKIAQGLKIIENLRGFTSGYAIPTYVIDAPGGGGKIPISPNYFIGKHGSKIILRNYEGKIYEYIES